MAADDAAMQFCLQNSPRRCCDLRPTYCGLKTWNAVPKKYAYLCGISVSALHGHKLHVITSEGHRYTSTFLTQTPRYPIPFRRSQFRPLVLPLTVFRRRKLQHRSADRRRKSDILAEKQFSESQTHVAYPRFEPETLCSKASN